MIHPCHHPRTQIPGRVERQWQSLLKHPPAMHGQCVRPLTATTFLKSPHQQQQPTLLHRAVCVVSSSPESKLHGRICSQQNGMATPISSTRLFLPRQPPRPSIHSPAFAAALLASTDGDTTALRCVGKERTDGRAVPDCQCQETVGPTASTLLGRDSQTGVVTSRPSKR
ncbi:unnamed protein product [Urochloa humidicola]